MDSLNLFKGYGKVNPDHLEDQAQASNPKTPQSQTQSRRPLIFFLTISALLCLTIMIGLTLAALIHEPSTDESPTSLSNNSAESAIKSICNVTRYPDSCFSSISSMNSSPKPDPEGILRLSLKISITEISQLASLFKDMNSENAAVSECLGQLEDAVSRVKESVSAMEVVGPGESVLAESKVKDIQTWVSSAMTDQETCSDGVEEMGLKLGEEVKRKMKSSMEYTSNSLAIVANLHAILQSFHIPLP